MTDNFCFELPDKEDIISNIKKRNRIGISILIVILLLTIVIGVTVGITNNCIFTYYLGITSIALGIITMGGVYFEEIDKDKLNLSKIYNLVPLSEFDLIIEYDEISKNEFVDIYDLEKYDEFIDKFYRDNPFMKGFLSDIYLRPSCYNCPAKKGRSGSDIQMADFWGIREVDRKFYSSKGVSMLIVHTQKGMDFLNKMKGWIKQIDEQVELLNQSYSHCAIPHPRREEFFYRVDNEDLISVINELTKQKITERVYFYIRVCLKYFRINHFINKMKAKWERK